MKRGSSFALLATLAITVLADTPAFAQPADPFQRILTIKNSAPITIYPIIVAPQPDNCQIAGSYRIVVNKDVEGAGIPSGDTVVVSLPKTQPCTDPKKGAFYKAVRISVSVAPLGPFESLLNTNQQTVRIAWDYAKDPVCKGCWVGKGDSDYPLDGPVQLLEYTIISQLNGEALPDPNDPTGTPFLDFDVSYVDHAYLPAAMAIADGGATQYMGSKLDYATFNARMSKFITEAKWARFGSFMPEQWATPAQCPTNTGPPNSIIPTSFSCMAGARTDRVPSAYGIIGSLSGNSQFYWPASFGNTPPQCGAAQNAQCSAPTLPGYPPNVTGAGLDPNSLCCPNGGNKTVGCCQIQNFIVGGTTYWWESETSLGWRNKTISDADLSEPGLVQRLTNWIGKNDPCSGDNAPGLAQSPAVDRAGFCAAFKRTADYVWSVFEPQCDPKRGASNATCIATNFIGYTLKASGYDPEACKGKCPGPDCPHSCVVEKLRTESVQALQRGVPWSAYGDPALCGGCPSEDASKCSAACVYPATFSPNATIYQNDGFLHFWPQYTGIYNLNPYARLIHDVDEGLASPGAYAFSIDDFYGNFGGRGSAMIVEVGGTSEMPNKDPFNPYERYDVAFGPGWDHVDVCGRVYPSPLGKKDFSVPVSFWSNGVKVPTSECVIKVYATASNTENYIAYLVKEVTYPAVDRYTGKQHSVQGLSGVFAVRAPTDSPTIDAYCKANSNGVPESKCTGNLTADAGQLDFVGISNAACSSSQPLDATCGKPLIHLAIPALN